MVSKRSKKTINLVVLMIIIINFNIYNIQAMNLDMAFKQITIDDGLSQSTVEVLFQDSNGYIWMGTSHGLNRYNGYDFKTYKPSKNEETSIIGNYIRGIAEDNYGNIWISTISGVSKIDANDDKITNYTNSTEHGSLSHFQTSDILITKEGKVLIATSNGVNLYDEDKDCFEKIFNGENELTSEEVFALDEDENGDIWVGTKDGLNKINPRENKVEYFKYSENELSIQSDHINKVYSDKMGYVWVGTSDKGLSKIDINTNEITNYENIQGEENSLAGNKIRDILRDNQGNIWICTENGVARYREESNDFVNYCNDENNIYSLINNSTYSIMQDSSGLIWVGTYEGVSIFNTNEEIMHYTMNIGNSEFLSSNMIHGIYEDENEIWVGTLSEGLNIIDKKDNTVTYIDEKDGLSNNRVNYIIEGESYVWVATNGGLNRINKEDKSIKAYTKDDGITDDRIKSILLDSRGNLLIGSPGGIYVLDIESDEITDVTYKLKENNIEDIYIQTIYEDRNGYYWLGTFLNGNIIRVDVESGEVRSDKINADSVRDIVETDDYLWFATDYGLNRLDKETGESKWYTQEDGLPNDMIYGILLDEDENFWMSTNYGISKFNTKEETFRNYNIADGLQSNEFNGGAYYKNHQGYMLFGGINGLNKFNPKDIQENEFIPNVEFEEFIVNGEVYKDINDLEFRYNENEITMKFFLPQYKDSSKTTYYYKIDEQDKEWKSTRNNEIIFKNLEEGTYTFRIKAQTYNGVMSEENIIQFTIKPHLLLSKEAFFVYCVIIIVVIYINLKKMKKLDKLVLKRTKQLREEMEKNNDLLNKVIQLEKNKNNYFVNLSHELRTPLNVILTTEQLIHALNKNEEGISKDKLDYHISVMHKNTTRLLNLINNIIDTSKIEHGSYQINIQQEDIVNIVEETTLGLKDYVESKNIELIIDPEIEEKYIECDRYEIERCIVNLISNAKKFTPEGGRIKVNIEDLGEKVKISVEDTGIGIAPKYQKYIFDRFNQVTEQSSGTKGGSGLGLTIIKHIVDLHNGEAFVESELNKGSKFTIVLPVKIN